MKECCEKFKEASGKLLSIGSAGYGPEMIPDAQIQYDEKSWNVNGCCGGGCYVLEKIEFCPWCGEKLQTPAEPSK